MSTDTPSPHTRCKWCGVTMGIVESLTGKFGLDSNGVIVFHYNGEETEPSTVVEKVYLCFWCRQEYWNTKEDRDEQTFNYFNNLIFQTLTEDLDRSVWSGI